MERFVEDDADALGFREIANAKLAHEKGEVVNGAMTSDLDLAPKTMGIEDANRPVGHRHSTFRQQILDVTQAEGEPEAEPKSLVNHPGGNGRAGDAAMARRMSRSSRGSATICGRDEVWRRSQSSAICLPFACSCVRCALPAPATSAGSVRTTSRATSSAMPGIGARRPGRFTFKSDRLLDNPRRRFLFGQYAN